MRFGARAYSRLSVAPPCASVSPSTGPVSASVASLARQMDHFHAGQRSSPRPSTTAPRNPGAVSTLPCREFATAFRSVEHPRRSLVPAFPHALAHFAAISGGLERRGSWVDGGGAV